MKLSFKQWNTTQRTTELESQVGTSPRSRRILLLHGLGGTGSLWRPLAAELEDECDLLAPDQRGHGESQNPSPPTYGPLDYGKDLVDTLDALNFHPTWVLGHSMGVRSACALAYLKPDWVQGLVLVDMGLGGGAGGAFGRELAGFLRQIQGTYPSRSAARADFDLRCPDPSVAQYLLAVSRQTGNGDEISFPFDRDALIQTIEAAQGFDLRSWLQEFGERNMPVYALRGGTSRVWTEAEFDEEKKRFSRFKSIHFMTIEGAGHGLPFEKRKVLVSFLRSWIEQYSLSQSGA